MDDSNNMNTENDAELNAATRRIPKSLIQEQIRIEREKALKKNEQEDLDKTTLINTNELNIPETKPEKPENLELADMDSTQAISIDKTMTMKSAQLEDFEPPKKEVQFNQEMNFPKPKKKASLTPWIIIAIIIIIAAILFSIIGKGKEVTKENKNISTINTTEKVTDEIINEKEIQNKDIVQTDAADTVIEKQNVKPDLLNKVKLIESISLTNENLSGESQKILSKKGAILSEENDPKLVAIVDALIKRLEITKGVKTSTRRGVLSKRWRGTYRGYKIDAQRKEKKGKVILNKILLTTPSRGIASINNGVLKSVKKLTYDKFIEELINNGISISEDKQLDENNVLVNLSILPPKNALSKKDFLLSASGIFGIKGGDGIESITLHLPAGFRVIKKSIEISEDITYNIHKVHNKQFHPLFFVKEWDERIAKVEIISTRFKTKEGIGVNSSLGLLRIYFPNLKISKTTDNMVIIKHEEIGGYFILDSTIEDFTNLNFKDSAKIIKIILE